MGLSWYDIHSPHHRGAGQIEVENGKVRRTSPAYRWALSLIWEDLYCKFERDGFIVIYRAKINSKSFDKPKKSSPSTPSDAALHRMLSS